MTEVLITGYHGYGNTGDEAILIAIKEGIEKMKADISLTALSYNPKFTKSEYGINAVKKFNVFQVLRAVAKCDVLLFGGGTLLQDVSSTRSLIYYLSILKLAKLFRKRIMIYANGIGPVTKPLNRKLIGKIVNKVDVITLREELSLNELKDMNVTAPPTYITADPVFNLQSESKETAQDILAREGVPTDKPIVGIAIREWKKSKYGEEYVREIAIACDSLTRSGKTVLFIPMEFKADIGISERARAQMEEKSYILSSPYRPKEILAVVGEMSLIISMRLHSLIFAGIKNVPMLGIVYDPKVEHYIDLLGVGKAADIREERLSGAELVKLSADIFDNYDKYKEDLAKRTAPLTEKAKKNDKLLKELIRKTLS